MLLVERLQVTCITPPPFLVLWGCMEKEK